MILKSSSWPDPNPIRPGTSSFQSRILFFGKKLGRSMEAEAGSGSRSGSGSGSSWRQTWGSGSEGKIYRCSITGWKYWSAQLDLIDYCFLLRTRLTRPDQTQPDPVLIILSCTDSRLTVSEPSLIWVLSKLQGRSNQGSWLYPNQYQDAKPQSGTSSILQSPKWGLKGHGCSLHLQNQDREPKFGIWSTKDQWPYPNQYQDAKPQSGTHIQIKIKSQTSVRNIQCPLKAHIMT